MTGSPILMASNILSSFYLVSFCCQFSLSSLLSTLWYEKDTEQWTGGREKKVGIQIRWEQMMRKRTTGEREGEMESKIWKRIGVMLGERSREENMMRR